MDDEALRWPYCCHEALATISKDLFVDQEVWEWRFPAFSGGSRGSVTSTNRLDRAHRALGR